MLFVSLQIHKLVKENLNTVRISGLMILKFQLLNLVVTLVRVREVMPSSSYDDSDSSDSEMSYYVIFRQTLEMKRIEKKNSLK